MPKVYTQLHTSAEDIDLLLEACNALYKANLRKRAFLSVGPSKKEIEEDRKLEEYSLQIREMESRLYDLRSMYKLLNRNGNIPANTPCPFIRYEHKGEMLDCQFFLQSVCPHIGRLKDHEFSCAAARLHESVTKK